MDEGQDDVASIDLDVESLNFMSRVTCEMVSSINDRDRGDLDCP